MRAEEERRELSVWRMDGWDMRLNAGRRGPPIDALRTRLAILENYGALLQEVRLESQVTH